MKKFWALALLLSATSAEATCNAQSSRHWVKGFRIEAFAQGPTCAQAVATLIVRNKSGDAVWAHSYITNFLMNFTQPPPAIVKALADNMNDWISGGGFMTSADKLVLEGEFPFTVNEAIDADALKRYRNSKAPIFCFIQGMESGNCLVLERDGGVVDLGVQGFPG